MRLALLIALLLSPLAAHADPVTAAVAAFAAWAGVGVATVYLVGATVLLSTGMAVYGSAQARRAERDAKNAANAAMQDRMATRIASDSAHRHIYGHAKVGVDIVAMFTSGDKDQFKHIVGVLAAHECDAVEEIYVNNVALGLLTTDGDVISGRYAATPGREVAQEPHTGPTFTLDRFPLSGTVLAFSGAGASMVEVGVTSVTGRSVTVATSGAVTVSYQYSVGRRFSDDVDEAAPVAAIPFVRAQIHLGGASDAADAYLMSVVPDKWPATAVLRGLTYIVVTLDLNNPEFQSGQVPIQALVRGKKLYDPRSGLTQWSANPALAVYDYLTSILCGVPAADLPVAQYITAANVCDETSVAGGRYTINGTVTSDQSQASVLEAMAQCMAGGIVSTSWDIYAGKYIAPVATLVQSDIVGSISITPGVSDAAIYNGVKGQYLSDENGYVLTDFKPYQNDAYRAADGRDLYTNIDFPFTNTLQRVTNLARIFVEDQRNGFTLNAEFSLKAWPLKVGQRIAFTSGFLGQSGKVYRITDKSYAPNSSVALTLKEDAASIWDFADAVTVDSTPNTDLPDPWAIAPLASIACTSGFGTLLRQADGTTVPRILATWPAATTQSVFTNGQVEIEWRAISTDTWQKAIASGSDTEAYLSPITPGWFYTVRARTVNPYLNTKSDWIVATHQVQVFSARAVVYKWAAAAPSAPAGTAAYAWGTQTFGAAPSGWSLTPPAQPITGADVSLWVASALVTDISAAGSTAFYWPAATVSSVGYAAVASAAAAAAANNAAIVANNAVTRIGDDGWLSKDEKPAIVQLWQAAVDERAGIRAQAALFSITTLDTAYQTAYDNLSGYLPATWNDYTVDTAIVRTVFNGKFNDYYAKKQALLNKIADEASKRAVWASGIAGRPADNELLNSYVLVGAVNLLRYSGQFRDGMDTKWTTNGSTVSIDGTVMYGTFKTLKLVGLNGAYNNFIMRLKPNTVYTVSAMVKASAAIGGFSNSCLHIQNWRDEDTGNVHQEVVQSYDQDITTSWKRVFNTFLTPASTALIYCRLYFYPLATGVSTYIGYAKLEEGNKPSDWSPAPEDLVAEIDAIANDNVLSKGEKSEVILKWAAIDGERTPIITQAAALSVTTTSYQSAYTALNAYLSALSPGYSDLTQDTPITGTTFRSTFAAYYAAKIDILNAMDAKAATMANWSSGITGRPADNELLNSAIIVGGRNLYPDSGFERGTHPCSSVANVTSVNFTTGVYTGTKGLFFEGNAGDMYLYLGGPLAPVAAGRQYIISFMYKTSGAITNDGGSVYFRLSDGSHVYVPLPVANTAGAWTRCEMAWTCPAGITTVEARFGIHNTGYAWMAVDCIQLEEGNKSTQWSPAPEDFTAEIDAIASDNVLSKGEKPSVILDWNAIQTEATPIYTQGTNLGTITERDSYNTAFTALLTYMNTLDWSVLTTDTTIVGTVFRTKFADYYAAKEVLRSAIAAKAATMATWGSTISGKPADSSLLNSYITLGADGNLAGAGGGGGVTLTGLGQKNFRVISIGGFCTTNPASPGIYLTGSLMYAATTTSYTVVIIDRATGSIDSALSYNVYGSSANATNMAAALNAIPSSKIVVVIAYNEPLTNRLTNGLDTAMYRCGASRAVFGSPKFTAGAGYILVGVAGCGEGNGAEAYQDGGANSWCDIGFNILNSNLLVTGTSFTPRTLADYSYTGDMNASSDITLLAGNMTVTGNRVVKTSGTTAVWDAAVSSKNIFTGGAYVSCVVNETATHIMIGLSTNPLGSNDYTLLEFAMYLNAGTYSGYESNSNVFNIGTYAVGDVMTVQYDGVSVSYLKNGAVVHTHKVKDHYLALYLDSSFYEIGASLSGIRFGPMSNVYQSPQASNGTTDNIFPDPQFRDLSWWDRFGFGVNDYTGANTFWKNGYAMVVNPASGAFKDSLTGFFPTTPGATYKVEFQVFKSADFSGWVSLYWHMPGTLWYPLSTPTRGYNWAIDGLLVQFDAGSPNGAATWTDVVNLADNSQLSRGQIRVRTECSAGYFEIGSISITRMADSTIIKNGAVITTHITSNAATDIITATATGVSVSGTTTIASVSYTAPVTGNATDIATLFLSGSVTNSGHTVNGGGGPYYYTGPPLYILQSVSWAQTQHIPVPGLTDVSRDGQTSNGSFSTSGTFTMTPGVAYTFSAICLDAWNGGSSVFDTAILRMEAIKK